ncbi:MAG: prenyltransferase/squalene oxidase repeat-containing protein [Armatimonadota bacterium]
MTSERVDTAFDLVLNALLGEMNPDGFWVGELSSSALSTATSVSALSIGAVPVDSQLIADGAAWLAKTQNTDGGWGDTPDSPSNLPTTLLVAASIKLAGSEDKFERTVSLASSYITSKAGDTADDIINSIIRIYGDDRTFAVPILMNCALAGMVPWSSVPALPFELAVFPQKAYKLLRLGVVSYALPALIAIGLTVHHNRQPGFLLSGLMKRFATGGALKKLAQIQPDNGGFLEAAPLTSFVAMSLGSIYGAGYPVVAKCLEFLRKSQRGDGSWPIDTDLSVWLTTGTVSALWSADRLHDIDMEKTSRWISDRQYKVVHPYTGAAPGGFSWTNHPGGVPDADDTSGAVLACLKLGKMDLTAKGAKWLLGLQNSDGGWPAFCRGWGQLAFDKSSPDITAHAIRALHAYKAVDSNARYRSAINAGFVYLKRTQSSDGSWIPLWFGNQYADGCINPVFGTARTLIAYVDFGMSGIESDKGVKYLINVQNKDGGWGGAIDVTSSVEETSLAVTALIRFNQDANAQSAVDKGIGYLVSCVEDGSWRTPSPIGLYFSSLWYSERLYPIIWTVEALGSYLKSGIHFPTG